MRLIILALAAMFALTNAATAAEKKAVWPEEMPRGGAYSPGVLVGDTLYVAGQIGWDPGTRQFPAEFEAEVKKCLENVGLVLRAAGMGYEDVVSVEVFLTDTELFKQMNGVYVTFFAKAPLPARVTVGASRLPGGKARIQVAVIARK